MKTKLFLLTALTIAGLDICPFVVAQTDISPTPTQSAQPSPSPRMQGMDEMAGMGFDETNGRHVPGDDEERESGNALHHRRFHPVRSVTVRRAGGAHRARNPVDQILEPNFEASGEFAR